jgi:hypothetical protein
MTCRPAARPAAQESAGAEPSGAALLLGVGARAHPGDRPRPPPARTSAATRARAGRCVRAPLSLRGHLPYPYHDCAMKCGYGDVQLQFWHGNHQRRRPPPAGLHACARSPARCRGASCGPPRAPAARGRGARRRPQQPGAPAVGGQVQAGCQRPVRVLHMVAAILARATRIELRFRLAVFPAHRWPWRHGARVPEAPRDMPWRGPALSPEPVRGCRTLC